MRDAVPDQKISARLIAGGPGWNACDVLCRFGPTDRSYDELHPAMSVAMVLRGTFTYESAGRVVLMTPGSILIGNAGECYQCRHEHAVGDRCISFHVSHEMVESVAKDLRRLTDASFVNLRIPPRAATLPIVSRAQCLLRYPDSIFAEETMIAAVGAALRAGRDSTEARIPLRHLPRVVEIARYLDNHSASPHTLASLAHAVGLGPHHFLRTFRQLTGVTPYAYLLQRRLHRAADLLAEGADNVLGVALAVGFGDLSEFTRQFKLLFGRPPAAYRNALRSSSGQKS